MLQLIDLTLKRGNKSLFESAALTVHAGHRVGLVGRNGIGKTTVFELIRERLLPEEGDVLRPAGWTIAHLEQEIEATSQAALDWVLDGDKKLRSVQRRIDKAETENKHEHLPELYEQLRDLDGYTAPARAGEILHGLGFDGDDFTQEVKAFSGGWRIRLNLAQTLMCPSDLLLLDEPTNHLDLDATLWLERWLLRYPGTLILISHDREFLDRVCTDIAHIEARKIRSYRGNYESFERQRREAIALAQSEFVKQNTRRKELESFINRFKAKASKARQAQSRMKALEKLTASAPVPVDRGYDFEFPNPKRISNPLLSLHEAAVGYGERRVLDGVEARIYPGARIALLGRNGAGKTTLIRTIAGELALQQGRREAGPYAQVGYFAQHQIEALNADKSPIWHIEERAKASGKRETEQRIRTFLGGWGFSGEMALDPVGIRSGGEKARLALALIAWGEPAILLLDEPTNHLDLDMRDALTLALQTYEGALVVVSHDRALLRACADEFWLVAQGRVRPFDGTLEDYSDWLLGRVDSAGTTAEASPSSNNDKKARRQIEAQRRAATQALRNDLRKSEQRLNQINNDLAKIHVALGDTALYVPERGKELKELTQQQTKLKRELMQVEERWLQLSESLDAAQQNGEGVE